MVRSISHTIEIDAAPEAVWRELADTGAYPDWNPFVRRLEGELEENARLEVEIEPLAGGRSRLTQAERFSGLLVRPFGGKLAKTERGFEAMNRALKERAEAS